MKDPVDHILRPLLPWREKASITECGLDASKVDTLSRAEFFQREKDYGKQRCAMMTCMTCSDTARRWGTWEDDPRSAVQREIEWEQRGRWYTTTDQGRGHLMRDELLAIAELVSIHRDEFLSIISTAAARRDWLAKKAEMKAKPAKPREPGGL